jgi:hypothetical protein
MRLDQNMLGPFFLKEIGELNFLINRTTQRPPSSHSGWKVEFCGPFGEKYIHCSSIDNLSSPTKGRKMKLRLVSLTKSSVRSLRYLPL